MTTFTVTAPFQSPRRFADYLTALDAATAAHRNLPARAREENRPVRIISRRRNPDGTISQRTEWTRTAAQTRIRI